MRPLVSLVTLIPGRCGPETDLQFGRWSFRSSPLLGHFGPTDIDKPLDQQLYISSARRLNVER